MLNRLRKRLPRLAAGLLWGAAGAAGPSLPAAAETDFVWQGASTDSGGAVEYSPQRQPGEHDGAAGGSSDPQAGAAKLRLQCDQFSGVIEGTFFAEVPGDLAEPTIVFEIDGERFTEFADFVAADGEYGLYPTFTVQSRDELVEALMAGLALKVFVFGFEEETAEDVSLDGTRALYSQYLAACLEDAV